MRFKFKTTNARSDKIPLLDVVITNPNNGKKVSYPALLDTGAFMSVFHNDVAKVLKIDLSKIKKTIDFSGVGTTRGELRGKPYIVNLMVAQKGRNKNFDSYVLFTKNLNPNGNPLLGRKGFIDQFSIVEISLSKDKFYLYS